MTVEILRDILGWCTLINFLLLAWWLLFFIFARDWMFRLHVKWFNFTPERFDTIHYTGMALYKLLIIFFNLIPFLVLHFLV